MPKASADTSETQTLELKSCEGGFVKARRLTYGEKIVRRSMTASMKIEGGKNRNKDFAGEMQLITEQSTAYDFQHCILDHNLFKDEAEEQKFDFTKLADIRQLDPRIGEEIDTWLSELNNFDDEDEAGN